MCEWGKKSRFNKNGPILQKINELKLTQLVIEVFTGLKSNNNKWSVYDYLVFISNKPTITYSLD